MCFSEFGSLFQSQVRLSALRLLGCAAGQGVVLLMQSGVQGLGLRV